MAAQRIIDVVARGARPEWAGLAAPGRELRWRDVAAPAPDSARENDPDKAGPPRAAEYSRLLRERRGARGWDEREIAAALRRPLFAALARLLRGDSAALLALPSADELPAARQALALLEPAPGFDRVIELRVAALPAGQRLAAAPSKAAPAPGAAAASPERVVAAGVTGVAAASPAAAAAALTAASAWISRKLSAPARPIVLDFAAGRPSPRRLLAEVAAALRARAAGAAGALPEPRALDLYAPLLRPGGRLAADEVLAALTRAGQGALPVVWSPQLDWAELGRELAALGGALSGVILAGAERPAAWAAADSSPESLRLTLALLVG